MEQPLVSICCIVYNHERYLEKCLDGILAQKVDFKYELIIHDDASTDKSPDIINDYYRRYPDRIKAILQTQNQYSQGKRILPILFQNASGKYLAICEGDDYWDDPLKLKKQVDFMENNPDCSLCFHNALIHWYDSDKPDEKYAEFESGFFSGEELLNHWICPTASLLFRNCFVNGYISIMNKYRIPFGDIPLVMYYSLHGKIYGFSETMSVYGKNKGGWTNYADAHKIYRDALGWEDMEKAFHKDYKSLLLPGITRRYLYSFKRSMEAKDYQQACKSFYRGVLRHPIQGVKSFFVILSRKKGKQTWCR